jgi:hypothetical protein
MSIPSNGITAEVFRDAMPSYQLSADLLAAMFTAIPAPPPGATVAWRQTRATRLVHEVSGPMPANAPQARIAAGIVIHKEAAEDFVKRSGAPGLRWSRSADRGGPRRRSARWCATSRSRCRSSAPYRPTGSMSRLWPRRGVARVCDGRTGRVWVRVLGRRRVGRRAGRCRQPRRPPDQAPGGMPSGQMAGGWAMRQVLAGKVCRA